MKKLIFLLVLGLLVVSCGKPSSAPVVETSPTQVVEPSPTEEIEEPTPTEKIEGPAQEPFSSSRARFVGLPPDEVQRLREQCLRENPDLLCIPFPVNPNAIQAYIQEFSNEFGNCWSQLVIQGPAGLEFFVPCDGVVTWGGTAGPSGDLYKPQIECGLTRAQYDSTFDDYTLWPPQFTEPGFFRQRPWIDISIHESNWFSLEEFESFVEARGGRPKNANWFDNVEVWLGETFFTLKTAEKSEAQKGQIVVSFFIRPLRERDGKKWLTGAEIYDMTEVDFLHDSEGRIVYIKP